MWRPFKQLLPKEHSGPSGGLEGRTIDVGNVKVHIREAIAEGGFSCVYLARDMANPAKQYALKHVIVRDRESLDLVQKEVTVMRSLKGHPNVVTLVAHAVLDMGHGREAFLLMEFCERSLVSALESRGAGFFDEEKVAIILRDVCNAVFAMHCQTPPIAHRDLKAENVLLGADGAWKLCDFGSVSTNHKCFDKPEERGIEEDIIRKHTTPAYRAPEMWDLYRREVISEKVDIWALGCLMYRICYSKLAFDGESKLQWCKELAEKLTDASCSRSSCWCPGAKIRQLLAEPQASHRGVAPRSRVPQHRQLCGCSPHLRGTTPGCRGCRLSSSSPASSPTTSARSSSRPGCCPGWTRACSSSRRWWGSSSSTRRCRGLVPAP